MDRKGISPALLFHGNQVKTSKNPWWEVQGLPRDAIWKSFTEGYLGAGKDGSSGWNLCIAALPTVCLGNIRISHWVRFWGYQKMGGHTPDKYYIRLLWSSGICQCFFEQDTIPPPGQLRSHPFQLSRPAIKTGISKSQQQSVWNLSLHFRDQWSKQILLPGSLLSDLTFTGRWTWIVHRGLYRLFSIPTFK